MDTQKQTGALPGMRTFAKDLENKRAVTQSSVVKSPLPKPAVVAEVEDDSSETHTYATPKWTAQKKSLVEKPTSETKKTDQETLTPITTPKSAGDTHIIVDNEDAESATIIRDTKKDRFKLIPAIFGSIKAWYEELKHKQAIKKIPKYTVPEATRRKGVIQKATSKTGKVMSFDTTSIQERIKQRQERAVPKTPLTIWTANTEPGFALLEAGENKPAPSKVTNVQTEPRKSARATPVIIPPTASVPVATPQTTVKVPPPRAAEKPIIMPATIVATPKVPLPTPVQNLAPQAEVLEPAPIPENPKTPLRGQSNLQPQSIREWLFTIDINAIAMGVTGLVVCLVVILGASYLWFNNQVEPLTLTTTPDYPSVLSAPLQPVYPSELTRESLYSTIVNNAQESIYEVLQLVLVTSSSNNTALPPATLFTALDIEIDSGFERSISQAYFGSIQKTNPFIVLSIADSTTAQGGMLSWEETLYVDFAPLFTIAGRNLNDNTGARFIDQTLANTDTRILVSSTGEDLLIYGIVNRNTVIITTSREDFTRLKNLLP